MRCNGNNNRKGAALLVVLFIVMAITIVSVGFLSRSDAELAVGRNMVIRSKMDFLAESAMEHAKGLILHPQCLAVVPWAGASAQQLIAGSKDYYDVSVTKTAGCNYTIDCTAYRLNGTERMGQSRLSAELRLDPCIGLWLGAGSTISNGSKIWADVYCDGWLTNRGEIYGDVFCADWTNYHTMTGRKKAKSELSLSWPRITVNDFTSHYPVENIDVNNLSNQTKGSPSSVRVFRRVGDLKLSGNVTINGMLIVDGNLTVNGNTINIIRGAKNLPALFVTGGLTMESNSTLQVYGLAAVTGLVNAKQGSIDLNVEGSLFAGNGIIGSGKLTVTADPGTASVIVWSESGEAQLWGPACGGVFKNIQRP